MPQTSTGKIGLATATIIGMNAMIGSGIFTAPATMAAYVGPAGIVAYIIVVISVWFMALSLARLAQLFPQEGSFYTYTKQWAGHTGGLIASCSYLIGLIIAMGLLAQVAGIYFQSLFLPNVSPHTLGMSSLITLVVLNMFGVVLSQLGQHILIVLTLFPLVITILMCFTKANFSNLFPFAPHGLGNALKATRVAIFSFFGFECAASLFRIVQNPAQNVPRALTYSIIIVGTLYTFFVTSLILAVPLHYFTSPTVPLHTILHHIFPNNHWLLTGIGISILSAILGTVHSMIWSSSELLVSLIKKIKPSVTCSQPLAVGCIGIAIFTTFNFLKNINLFLFLTALFIVSAYILSIITLLTLKREWESGRNIKTLMGITTASAILYFALEGIIQELIKIT